MGLGSVVKSVGKAVGKVAKGVGSAFKSAGSSIASAFGSNPLGTIGDIVGLGSSVMGMFGGQSGGSYKYQKEFAQKGIQWRVEDAKRAGIHPLYALGANSVSYNPAFTGDDGKTNSMRSIGQNLNSMGDKAMSATEKQAVDTINALNIERLGTENDILKIQAEQEAFRLQQMRNPPAPSVDPTPITPVREMSHPGHPESASGTMPQIKFADTATGLKPVPSEAFKQSSEDNIFLEAPWFLENYVLPMLGLTEPPPLPDAERLRRWPDSIDAYWTNRNFGEYRPIYKDTPKGVQKPPEKEAGDTVWEIFNISPYKPKKVY